MNVLKYIFNKNKSDAELIQLFKSTGHPYYLEMLFKRYELLLLGLCLKYMKNREDAEDQQSIIQEKTWKYLQINTPENYYSWLYTCAKNTCLNALEKLKSEQKKSAEFILESGHINTPDKSSEDIKNALLNQLHRELKKLKPEQRLCIELFFFQNKSYNDIVHETGFDLKKVKSLIQNGKRNLKINIE